tara:strand:- start:95 stop:496 length:402 start_codon:yes stop_codon:yes gene_type:complete
MSLKRFGVSLEENLLEDLDTLVKDHKFPNRSQAIRYLIKKNRVEDQWEWNEEVAGAIVLVYDHHKRNLQSQSTEVQHHYHDLILSVQHVHLNHDNCLETITVKGKAKDLVALSNELISIKGISHGQLVMSSAE